ncbi:nucleotidyltransferase family protein [Acinetobacter rathckeae]|uniref:nucleotidyltransferase family protein n=1 Tax=Acinetobacter rathckeae TaxID=2605272 RepID=UPI0018A2F305|nr:nucleotidyltransferase family protein [Acinetobacter rathckeae]MBF7688569.1 nucleotidyltransferase family protein [Acinetobacter rathckeae]
MPEAFYREQLKHFLLENKNIYNILLSLSKLSEDCYISAGILRNAIWSDLHGYEESIAEIDVIYYDKNEQNQQKKQFIGNELSKQFPNYEWDITNQAEVHTWYKTDQNQSILPLHSVWYALSLWPETATAIAVRLAKHGQFELIAPFGLSDLFELKLRWNKNLVSEAVFNQRITKKRFMHRWPQLSLEPPLERGIYLARDVIYL